MTLEDLAARVEALEGPDRRIDVEIAWLTCWRWDGWEEGDIRIEGRDLAYLFERVDQGHNSIWLSIPRYTASLDAAMTLAPQGWFRLQAGKDDWIALGLTGTWRRGAAPALALTAAALHARARALSRPTENGEGV